MPAERESGAEMPEHERFLLRRLARSRHRELNLLLISLLEAGGDAGQLRLALRELSSRPTAPSDPEHVVTVLSSRLWQEWEYWQEDQRSERRWR